MQVSFFLPADAAGFQQEKNKTGTFFLKGGAQLSKAGFHAREEKAAASYLHGQTEG